MNGNSVRRRLLASTMICGVALGAATVAAAAAAPATTDVSEIVVTGSRIKQASDTTTAAPVLAVDAQTITDKGFTQAGQVINDLTSAVPSVPEAPGSGAAAGNGQTFPNLFGLGVGRTLTLVNGRRFVTSSSGLGDRVVDTNIIPTGLIQRVDVVQAGGAAVYGSDAIAGVINYVLKDKFEGLELDAQYGESSRGDYATPHYRVTYGRNFLGGRGNVALDVEWSKTDPLLDYDRPRTNLGRITVANAANTSATDGIPAVRENLNTRFWEFNYNGLLFTPAPAPVPAFIFSQAGVPQQFNTAGNGLIPYNLGVSGGIPFNSGGEGLPYQELASLYVGIERLNGNVVAHYDITDHMKLSGELLYAHTKSRDPYQVLLSNTVLNGAATGAGAIPISRQNPFIPASVSALLGPGGPPLFLSKAWAAGDLIPSREGTLETDTFRGVLSLDGDFDVGSRNFYYSLSFSRAETEGGQRAWGTWTTRFNAAVQATRNSAGAIVCAINADANPANDDPNCAPINPFGQGNVSQQARTYIDVVTGQDYVNTQDDFLATIGGDLFELPAGKAKFSGAYEHRAEFAKFVPLPANQLGLTGSQVATVATRGDYHTNELSAEVLIPVIGGDFTLPFAKLVELNGQYRRVDNSIAGTENVWGFGGRWEAVSGLTFRASRSRNFRAPTLDMLFAPSRTALANVGNEPCDLRFINNGPAPAIRQANCQALFAQHPSWGPLATFQDPSVNFNNALVTVGGNANLKNEISDTTTYGVVLQPAFIPGLTIVADHIQVDLTNGLSAFTPLNFEETCFDVSPQPAAVCSTFTRDPATGFINTATSTTFNAGLIQFRGEVYNAAYQFPLSRIFGEGREYGDLQLNLEATHTSKLVQSVTGVDRIDFAGSYQGLGGLPNPKWVTRFDAHYTRGPFRATYELFYLPSVKFSPTATIETVPTPTVDSNIRHSVSAQYDFGHYTVRAGVINLTDEEPSYPTRNYGDILGRQYFVGLRARF
ncbi:MAG: TonB-dependent receptor plug domain-containing protein [Phenylobacterium sp.]